MKMCSICKSRIPTIRCRRCQKYICEKCYGVHGLCIECARKLGKM